jgi:hypothetical protein
MKFAIAEDALGGGGVLSHWLCQNDSTRPPWTACGVDHDREER